MRNSECGMGNKKRKRKAESGKPGWGFLVLGLHCRELLIYFVIRHSDFGFPSASESKNHRPQTKNHSPRTTDPTES
jgi:hypothetical protein